MNEYASNLSVFVCAFFEFILIGYIYGRTTSLSVAKNRRHYRSGFNRFMEDIRMMLGKRPLEPYWFFTWCISGPIITLVLSTVASVPTKLFSCVSGRLFLVDPSISNANRRRLRLSDVCQCSRLVDGLFFVDFHSSGDDLRVGQSMEANGYE